MITGTPLGNFVRATESVVLTNFYARRFLLMMPIFYVTLCALVPLDIRTLSDSWPWHAAYLSNVYIAFGGEKTIFWSLAVAEQFYLVWPFSIALNPPSLLLRATLAVVASGPRLEIRRLHA